MESSHQTPKVNGTPKYLILPGAPGTGKTGSLTRLVANFLLVKKGFVQAPNQPPGTPYRHNQPVSDFLALFENPQTRVKIVVNTSMDYARCADLLTEFVDKCSQSGLAPGIIITAARDDHSYPADYFWEKMKISPTDPDVIQVPLARITRRGNRHSIALAWYQQRIDALLAHILSKSPFNI